MPFYHLKSEGFWFFETYFEKEIALTSSNSIRSFAALKESVDYVRLDENLYQLLLDQVSRSIRRETLLSTYFPNASIVFKNELIDDIINQILHDPAATYRTRMQSIVDPEEIFVHSYSICQFKGRQILLPTNKRYFPPQGNLQSHWERFNY